jgi:hypothetical protein
VINPTSVLNLIERWSKFIEPTYTLLRSNTISLARVGYATAEGYDQTRANRSGCASPAGDRG